MATTEKQLTSQSLDDVSPKEKDVAVLPLSDATEDIEATYGVNEKALLRKLDLKLLPALTFLYLLSFLDRSNGSFQETLILVQFY
jgi:hypothetical protein